MRVTHAIESVNGVRRARVSFESARAEVESDRCTEATYVAISEALYADGYGGTVLSVEALEEPAGSTPPPRPAPEAL